MSNIVFGEVDWNSEASKGGGAKANFMKLEVGRNVIRVMGNPVQYFTNWVDDPSGKTKGRQLNSPVSSPELLQRLEDAGFKRKPRWLVKVLDRSDNEFKLLEIGSQVYNGIKQLVNDEAWGKVTGYDLTITRGKPGTQPLYAVSPRPKSGLDESLKEAFLVFNDGLNIDRLIQPSDPKYVLEYLGWEASLTGKTAGKAAQVVDDEDEEGFEFSFK